MEKFYMWLLQESFPVPFFCVPAAQRQVWPGRTIKWVPLCMVPLVGMKLVSLAFRRLK